VSARRSIRTTPGELGLAPILIALAAFSLAVLAYFG